MELKIELAELQKRKLFVATPMYGGQCAGMYTRSISDLAAICAKYQIQLQLYFLFNESLITRARNYCADEFMRSNATHLMFIDSDIGFNPQDVIAMLAMMTEESDYDVMGGPYPKKCISWEKIVQAVNKGVADDNAST
jgi:glycosyltransferase involved in cell wall biosynthesis